MNNLGKNTRFVKAKYKLRTGSYRYHSHRQKQLCLPQHLPRVHYFLFECFFAKEKEFSQILKMPLAGQAVVAVQWSVCSPSSLTIKLRILLKSTAFSVKKNATKQSDAWNALFKKWQNIAKSGHIVRHIALRLLLFRSNVGQLARCKQ